MYVLLWQEFVARFSQDEFVSKIQHSIVALAHSAAILFADRHPSGEVGFKRLYLAVKNGREAIRNVKPHSHTHTRPD